jgi:hypothetical protein
MKTQIIICGLAANLLVGCASETTNQFIPVEGRFGYVAHVRKVDEGSISVGFCYRDANGNATVVWPYLQMVWGNNMVISNDTALLVGGIASLYKDGNERLSDRLIAFKGPTGPPMDITDQVLLKYYTRTGFGLTNFMWDSFNTLTKTNGSIQILFCSTKIRAGSKNIWDPFDCTLTISWNEIDATMQDVKKNGKLKKEKWSGFEYLQKD